MKSESARMRLSALGTESELSFNLSMEMKMWLMISKTSARAKRKSLEEEGKMDSWSSMQQNVIPTIDENVVGFKIDMLF